MEYRTILVSFILLICLCFFEAFGILQATGCVNMRRFSKGVKKNLKHPAKKKMGATRGIGA